MYSLPQELLNIYSLFMRALQENSDKSAIQNGGRIFRLVLYARCLLSIEEFRHALAIAAHADAAKKVQQPSNTLAHPNSTEKYKGLSFNKNLFNGISKRISHCSGNMLETKGISSK